MIMNLKLPGVCKALVPSPVGPHDALDFIRRIKTHVFPKIGFYFTLCHSCLGNGFGIKTHPGKQITIVVGNLPGKEGLTLM